MLWQLRRTGLLTVAAAPRAGERSESTGIVRLTFHIGCSGLLNATEAKQLANHAQRLATWSERVVADHVPT